MIGCLVSCGFILWIMFGKLVHGTTWAKPVLVTDGCNFTGEDVVSNIMSNVK